MLVPQSIITMTEVSTIHSHSYFIANHVRSIVPLHFRLASCQCQSIITVTEHCTFVLQLSLQVFPIYNITLTMTFVTDVSCHLFTDQHRSNHALFALWGQMNLWTLPRLGPLGWLPVLRSLSHGCAHSTSASMKTCSLKVDFTMSMQLSSLDLWMAVLTPELWQNVFWHIANTDLHYVLSFDQLHSNNSGLFGHHLWEVFKTIIKDCDCASMSQVDGQWVAFLSGRDVIAYSICFLGLMRSLTGGA